MLDIYSFGGGGDINRANVKTLEIGDIDYKKQWRQLSCMMKRSLHKIAV